MHLPCIYIVYVCLPSLSIYTYIYIYVFAVAEHARQIVTWCGRDAVTWCPSCQHCPRSGYGNAPCILRAEVCCGSSSLPAISTCSSSLSAFATVWLHCSGEGICCGCDANALPNRSSLSISHWLSESSSVGIASEYGHNTSRKGRVKVGASEAKVVASESWDMAAMETWLRVSDSRNGTMPALLT